MALATVNGTEIWYEAHGGGTPLLLLPGLGMDHHYYRLAAPLLQDVATVILVDVELSTAPRVVEAEEAAIFTKSSTPKPTTLEFMDLGGLINFLMF